MKGKSKLSEINGEQLNEEEQLQKEIKEDKKTITKKTLSASTRKKSIANEESLEDTIVNKNNAIKEIAPLKEKVVKVKDIVAKEVANNIEDIKNDIKIEEDIKKAIINKKGTTKKIDNKQTNKNISKPKNKKSNSKTTNKSNIRNYDEKKIDLKVELMENELDKLVKKVDKSDITNFNTFLFHQGKNYESYNILGSHIKTEKRKKGVQFSTWAPNAKEVYVVGEFNDFKVKDEFKLTRLSENGLWSGFFPGIKVGAKYKYCIVDKHDNFGEYKADPYAIQSELRPNTASIVYKPKNYKWNDKAWINKRSKINVLEQPINIYEVHLGSWKKSKEGEFLTYEEISNLLPAYAKEMGYTHVEFMPLVEHPLDASWGYQGTGYYSPTSRYGNLESLKVLIDKLHQMNIGVILDWAPGHFCKDAHGLYKFDGSATYEYQEEWRSENRGWGTCNFDLGRPEVKSYLISNALYWYREFHIDGIRVDAVSSILYLNYSRNFGEWMPNKYGGSENLEAIDFLKELNEAVFKEYPTALMIAEESTSWPNVTKPPSLDGLGFNFKWNMGWMNDTLKYIELDTNDRKYNHRNITFSMMYNYAENYILPISHDEVVHGKKSLVNKMWGDYWNKFAGLRAFMGYMIGHPGKKLLFMGCEFGQFIEWREYEELQWNLIDEFEMHKETHLFFKDLNKFYIENKALWQLDYDNKGFNWIEADNNDQSILIFNRKSRNDDETLIFIINFTSVLYYDYQIGVPFLGEYEEAFNSDNSKYGGSGQTIDTILIAEDIPYQNQPYSLRIKVPPMATLILRINEIKRNEINVEDNIEINDLDLN